MSDLVISDLEALARDNDWSEALGRVIAHFGADSGTIHLIGDDGMLHLAAASRGIPDFVINTIRIVPVGKGMAGLAVERRQPVDACNIQTDTSGDVRPGARATGLQGAIVIPMMRGEAAAGALGIANRAERTFTDAETDLLMAIGRALASFVPVAGLSVAKP